ncbi:MAG: EamA family transporter [Candidatus Alcyoniella australis]|nr:EamA family transporter [Candidatus Alcyoniella australis]
MKVEVLKQGFKAFRKEHRRDLAGWASGFLLTFAASPLLSYAMKLTDKAGIVSATCGVGIVGLVIFASVVLKERFGKREAIGCLMVLAGTMLMGYFNKPIEIFQGYPIAKLFIVIGIIGSFTLLLCVAAWKTNKLISLTFGATAGLFIGFSLMLADLALIQSGNDFLGQLKNPFPYIALTTGTVALVLTQLAFFRGRAMVIVPTINSIMIASPPILELIVLGTVMSIMQVVGLLVILGGVLVLTTKTEGIRAT